MSFFRPSTWLNRLSLRTPGGRRSKLASASRLRLEPLEDRLAPAVGLATVNDNWAFIADNDASSSLTVGDTVRNNNDTIGTGTITRVYGVDGFGTVTTGAFTGSVAGAATINDAIANTVAGGTVRVLEGTYSQNVTVNKSLVVQGAQQGVDARNPRGVETVLDGTSNSGITPFNVTANDVTIDGFTVQGATNVNQFGFGIVLGAGTSGAQVLNNIIQNNIAGLSLANNPAGNAALIQNNLFQNNNQPGPVSGTAIYSDQFIAGGNLANVTIDANTFIGNNGPGVNLASTQANSVTSITVSNNTLTNNGNGVLFFNTSNSTIFRNTISGSIGSQVGIFDASSDIQVTQNFIIGGQARGVRVEDFGGGPNSDITITSNAIFGNALAGLAVGAGAYTGTLDATGNWWGSPTGPTDPRNPGGTGEEIVDPDFVVDFSPFLTNGTDAEPGTPGFQPAGAPIAFTTEVVNGTAGDDTLVITITGPNSGTYSLNGGPAVPFTGVGMFVFDGGAGTDLLVLDSAGRPIGTVPDALFAAGIRVVYPNVERLNLNNATSVETIAGPNTADRAAAFAGLNAQQRFVQALYLDELGRAASISELNGWVAVLNGPGGAAAVARGIASSFEARDNLVDSWYGTFLGRSSNGTEEQGWVAALLQGQSEEDVLSGILGSAEFFQRAQTLVGSGTPSERFVQALYQLLLNRTGGASEVGAWVSVLPQIGTQGVARSFLASAEFRADLFEGYYNALLRRRSDDAGLNGWVSSGLDAFNVRVNFESTGEFFVNG